MQATVRPGLPGGAVGWKRRTKRGTGGEASGARGAKLGLVGLAFAAIYVIWGSTYLAIAYAVETIPPLSMMGVRFLAAGMVLYGWARVRGAPRPRAEHWRGAAEIGAALFLVTHGLIGWAEVRMPSGLAALLGSTVPFWMVVLSWAGEGRRPGRRVVRGIATGLLGVTVLVWPGLRGDGTVDLAAAAAVLVAALAWSWGSLRAKRVAQPASQAMATSLQLLAGGALLVLSGAAVGEVGAVRLDGIAARSLLALGYLVVFGSIVAYSAYAWLLRTVSPTRVATHAFVNPIVAVTLGWFAGEPVGMRTLVAALMIVAAVVWIVLPAEGPGATPPPSPDALARRVPAAASYARLHSTPPFAPRGRHEPRPAGRRRLPAAASGDPVHR